MAKKLGVLILFISILTVTSVQQAHAMDRKVAVMFKSAGYGTAAGFLVGAATWTMGIGSSRNLFRGASLGLYAGIILGAYILISQDQERDSRPMENPWHPRQPVGPDDWKDEDLNDMSAISVQRFQIAMNTPDSPMPVKSNAQLGPMPEVTVWTPVFGFRF